MGGGWGMDEDCLHIEDVILTGWNGGWLGGGGALFVGAAFCK